MAEGIGYSGAVTATGRFAQRVAERLQTLDGLLDLADQQLARVREVAALPADHAEVLGRAVAQAAELAAELAAEVVAAAEAQGLAPAWADRAGLLALAEHIERRAIEREQAAPRARLRALAGLLERGTISHRTSRRRDELGRVRKAAVDELRARAEVGAGAGAGGQAMPLALPGPERAGGWLAWAWGLEEPRDAEVLERLREGFPELAAMVEEVEPSQWVAVVADHITLRILL